MSLYRVLFSLLIITSLLAGPAIGDEPTAKKDGERTEKEVIDKKESPKHDSKEHQRKNNESKKDDKQHKHGDQKKDKQKASAPKKPSKDAAKEEESKREAKPKKEVKPAPQKEEQKKDEKPKPSQDDAKDKAEKKDAGDPPKEDAPKKEMKPEPKKEEPTPAKTPAPEPKIEAGKPKQMESKLEPKAEEKHEQIPAPKEAPKPEPKPVPPPVAKPDPKKLAATDLSQVDEDFALQGEYYGKLRLPGGILETTGIQVIARGDGNFVGRQLRGGLPGNGWRNGQLIDLSGKRDGETLVLSQGNYQVLVRGGKAIVVNSAGDTLGILTKVQRRSELLGLKPSSKATVLFDGTSTDKFIDAKVNEKGELQIGTVTKDPVQDFRLHIEFRLPYMPYALGQARSNSGLYIQERYEVQILDSFGLPGEFNECGSLYRTKSPDINMCFPPLAWQTYDVYFTAARFDNEGNKISPARITVQHNGILVQDNYLIPNKTGAGKPEGADARPIKLQDHGNPVVFRNVWIEYLGGPVVTNQAETIVTPEKN
ncbi:hypothetical protein C5Y96_22245 [Blastopirellula marina]|uniref:3-keto-alpha-glucoside-1,2-lyase/3-keto-2-hydroxy-glucal hydratase domain-containing protein n=1 Tax=Blastopirellula marina TaxID=124 RepID=A0A2S8F1V3_9BACT|nr:MULTISPECIES: DUF1080 domain-containing protein [Pirellulaceae]PQO26165.1 hypothetical protein C5Y96_22245 [Blastopirellula marina]RCS44524.1 DUF1080 domain-containing protein [Bremerella cremea]